MFVCIYVWWHVCTYIHIFLHIVFWGSKHKLVLLLRVQPKRMETRCMHIFNNFGNNKEMICLLEKQQDNTLLLFTTVILMRSSNFENLGRCPLYWDVTLFLANSESGELLLFSEKRTEETLKFNIACTDVTRKLFSQSGIARAPCTLLLATEREERWKK